MKVNSIKLHNYRNYRDLELSFDGSRNILIGENAQGKTNLIEAIYMCAFARSFRTKNARDMIAIGENQASINIESENQYSCNNTSITIDINGNKMIKNNGKIIRKTSELLNKLVIVAFTPDDLRIIKDSPGKRRDFINKELSQLRPTYYELLRNYNDVLKHRNALLKSYYDGNNQDMLDVYDMQLENYGTKIINYRKKFVSDLSYIANSIQNKISGNKENLEIEYICSVDTDNYYNELARSRERDIYRGHTGIGPHVDDLEFYINGNNAKLYGSQGQQRTIALSLKLAEIQIAREYIGENPILLLDDVLSELDSERQSFLLSEIEDTQLFITTTEVNENIIEKMPNGRIFGVFHGNVEIKR